MTTTETITAEITDGPYILAAPCPDCGQRMMFPIELEIALSMRPSTGKRLRPALTYKSQEHRCDDDAGQQAMFEGNGEAPM